MEEEKRAARPESRVTEGTKTGFFKGVQREFSRISWPTRKDLIKQTVAVVVISVLAGVAIALLDMGFSTVISLLSGVA